MPFSFATSLAVRIVVSYLLVTALICSMYLVEQFVPLLESSLRFAFGGWAFGKLLVLTLPRLIEFALPLAALCVAYFAILEARERRELLVMAASGASYAHLAVAALAVGAIAGCVSLGISGYVKPAANFAYRSTLRDALNDVLSKGTPVGAFYAQNDSVLYSRPSEGGPLRILRLFEFQGERLRQLLVTDCARMQVEDGVVLARTCDLKGYRFGSPDAKQRQRVASGAPPCVICRDDDGSLTVTRLAAGESAFSFAMGDVFTVPVRNHSGELTLAELLAGDGDRFRSDAYARVAAIKMLSAIACVVGLLLALVAVAFTTFRTRILALPLACGVMMVVLVLANSQVWLLDVGAGRTLLFLKLAALALGSVPLTVLTAKLVYGRLTAPALAKP